MAGIHQQQIDVLSSGESDDVVARCRRRERRRPDRDAARAELVSSIGKRRRRGANLTCPDDARDDQLARRVRGR
ncbi:MAG: hypothetical protein ACXVSF_22640 [Solirubrobacteraceae bacterium]